MPILKKIVIQDFKNISFQELEFSRNVNCISGNNGEGKTNLLDAVHYLSMTKSYIAPSDRNVIRHGADSFSMSGTYLMEDGLTSVFSVSVSSDGSKVFKRDDKKYQKMSDHIGKLPVVMVSPQDTAMVSESGEERRRFSNTVLCQMDSEYLYQIQQYNRLLSQRNRLLKEISPDDDLLSIFDERMSISADAIFKKRLSFVESLSPVVKEYYAELSGGKEDVGIEYRSDLEKGSLASLLQSGRDRDRALKYTSAGVHRDDFVFMMDGHPIRRYGSQGQQKSFLVSLKFAQYDIMREWYGFSPVLLLDDLFDKLDMGRVSNLLSMVAGSDFGQIFLTDSNKVRLAGIIDALTDTRTYFDTSSGVFTKVED